MCKAAPIPNSRRFRGRQESSAKQRGVNTVLAVELSSTASSFCVDLRWSVILSIWRVSKPDDPVLGMALIGVFETSWI